MSELDVTSMQSTGRTLVLTFHTDVSDRYLGFVLSYDFIDDPSQNEQPNGDHFSV